MPTLMACSASAVVVAVVVAVWGSPAPVALAASVPMVWGYGPVVVQVLVPLVCAGVVWGVGWLAVRVSRGDLVAVAASALGVLMWIGLGLVIADRSSLYLEAPVFRDSAFAAVAHEPVWSPVQWLYVVAVALMFAGPVVAQRLARVAYGLDTEVVL